MENLARMNQKTIKLIRKYCKALGQDEEKVKRIYKSWDKGQREEFGVMAKIIVNKLTKKRR